MNLQPATPSSEHEQDTRIGAAARFIDARQARGQLTFQLEDLQQEIGGSLLAAPPQLMRLGARVTRVKPRRDFFLIVSPEYRLMGAPPIDWWLDDFCRYLQQPYYVGLLSAAAMHGASQQAVQVVQVVTNVPTRKIELGRLCIEFFVKNRVSSTAVIEAPHANAPMLLSTPEATALDLIAYAHRIGGIARAVQTIVDLRSEITVGGLRKALKAVNSTPDKQRLGFIFESLGWDDLCAEVTASLTRRLAPVMLQPYMLHAGSLHKANAIWQVIDNIGMEHVLL